MKDKIINLITELNVKGIDTKLLEELLEDYLLVNRKKLEEGLAWTKLEKLGDDPTMLTKTLYYDRKITINIPEDIPTIPDMELNEKDFSNFLIKKLEDSAIEQFYVELEN